MKKKNLPYCILTSILIVYASCSPYPKDVQEALQQAHENSLELRTVLEHYRGKDSLKFKAACFLIANMPYHKSREEITLPKQYDNYFNTTDSLFHIYFGRMTSMQIKNFAFKIPDSIRNSLAARYNAIPLPSYSAGKKDIESVTSTFLIDNIEEAFKVWRTSPLLKDMPFEEFKEVILPYRITDEPLLYSKTELQRKFYPILSLEGMDKITVPIERYKMYILKQQRISYYTQEVIPEVLSLPTLQDETFRYHQTVSLRLPFDIQTNNKLAYLSFVTRSGIVPIGWGEIDAEKKMAMFHQVPLAMTFILSYYDGDS